MRISEPDERGRPKKESLPWEGLGIAVGERLDAFQTLLYDRALARREAKTVSVDSWDDFTELFKDGESSFVWAHWDGTSETELAIKDATKTTIRCIPYEEDGPTAEPGVCIKTGNPSAQRVLFSKNY
ncbi:MAG: hypothetical protein GY930_14930 [bacterium]|nr:hypothetical protein [bacterium]